MKGAPIKPGTLCLFRSRERENHPDNGKVVTAIRKVDTSTLNVRPQDRGFTAWEIVGRDLHAAYWSRDGKYFLGFGKPIMGIFVHPSTLTPISDPDADVSDDEQNVLTTPADHIKFDFNFDLPSKV